MIRRILDALRLYFSRQALAELEIERDRTLRVSGKLTKCMTTQSATIKDFKEAITQREEMSQKRQRLLSEKDQIQSSYETLQRDYEILEREKKEAESYSVALKDSVENLTQELVVALNEMSFLKDISPSKLKTLLQTKLPFFVDKSQEWNNYDEVLNDVFKVPDIVAVEVPTTAVEETLKKLVSETLPEAKDSAYFLCSVEEARKIITNDWGNLRQYVPDRKDCDKFAQRLRVHFNDVYGLNNVIEIFGYWGAIYHSWVLIVCSDGVLEVEPQTDEIASSGNLPDHKVVKVRDW